MIIICHFKDFAREVTIMCSCMSPVAVNPCIYYFCFIYGIYRIHTTICELAMTIAAAYIRPLQI